MQEETMWGVSSEVPCKSCRFAQIFEYDSAVMKIDIRLGLWAEEFFALEPDQPSGLPSGWGKVQCTFLKRSVGFVSHLRECPFQEGV
jgi:hypothetical protein